MVARELKGGWDLSTEFLFVFLQEMEGERASTFCRWLLSPRSSWEASVPEKQCTAKGINSLEKDAKRRVPGQGCLQRNNLAPSSTRIPWLQTAKSCIMLVLWPRLAGFTVFCTCHFLVECPWDVALLSEPRFSQGHTMLSRMLVFGVLWHYGS